MKIGIDFGTSFSLPAGIINGSPSSLLPDGEYGIPSVFYYDSEVGILVGNAAEDNAEFQPLNVKRDIKMEINSPVDSFIADGRIFSKKQIVGHIFGEIIRISCQVSSTRKLKSQSIDGAVISVPAAFTLRELNFILESAKVPIENGVGDSELKILGFIREPVAAAIAYFNAPDFEDNKTIMVYDLGGGTCDVAIVKSNRNSNEWYKVIDSDMQRIGGRDWDKVLIDMIKRKYREKAGTIRFDTEAEFKISKQAIHAKHILSNHPTARVTVSISGKTHSCVITTEEFEKATHEVLQNTMTIVEKMMKKYSSQINNIVCVGGSSNMPQVRRAFEQKYPEIPVKLFEPEKAIAYGAAIYAEHLTEEQYLRDISKFSYGIKFIDNYGRYHDINRLIIQNGIIKGSRLPACYETTGSPIEDGLSNINFAIYESECTDSTYKPENGTAIGQVSVSGLKNSKKTDIFTATLELDQSGLLHAKAVEEKTGNSVTTEIQLIDY